ncbi:hypothetical protein HHK36_020664 [Tetracentron sinense]|uniref:Transcription factor MUTE n=1 Tax=Tetracentron sinense TaxID=13715 RepID=A0A835D919_TETSI|nr:hypothetical protein HHK36_020664 [Tetracentron sinense]
MSDPFPVYIHSFTGSVVNMALGVARTYGCRTFCGHGALLALFAPLLRLLLDIDDSRLVLNSQVDTWIPLKGYYSGDQASIIAGVIEFIKELHEVLRSLESKKQRKSLSPGPGPSPRPLQLTPTPDSPFGSESVKELSACCNSSIADVEAKISGSNVILRTISRRIPGQIVKIISLLEKFSFEILHLNISTMEDTVLYSFVIKVCKKKKKKF